MVGEGLRTECQWDIRSVWAKDSLPILVALDEPLEVDADEQEACRE
jgi:hypothetical protein